MRRPRRCPALIALVGLVSIIAAPWRSEAQPAPYRAYVTLPTPHFRVHVPLGLEREGRVAGAAAERAYAALRRELVAPRGLIDLIVTDDADFSNGFATPIPGNRMAVFATPPVQARSLRLNDDWLEIVVTHELAHIFHLDRARGLWGLGQRVFGRVPLLFPNAYGPAWLTEGLAVYYESRLTQGGRLRATEQRAMARAAAGAQRLPTLDQLSLSTPRFPGGEGVYSYGALFLDYLARTRGDSAVPRFVESQSAQLFPLALNRAARRGFGVSFVDAFSAFRDSVQRSVGTSVAVPLAGWRDLTTHGFYASAPRWVNDTTLVYTGTDGRETNAAWLLTLSGQRTRLGRRSTQEASVPTADAGLLFAQLEIIAPGEVRSDLYEERAGRVTRLTRGSRFATPDLRRQDGAIVAVQLGPTRSSLVLLDGDARLRSTLREAGPDETWSEPRWSPDGSRIVAIHRQHGGTFSLEVIDVATGVAITVDRARSLITSPSWSPDGRALLYVSDESGTSALAHATLMDGEWRHGATAHAAIAGPVYAPELSPRGDRIAAVTLRADGYHIGIAPASSALPATALAAPVDPGVAADSQPLAAGTYSAYSPWRSLAPRYWLPVIESGVSNRTRLGVTTSGQDAVGRHYYSAYAALQTDGRKPVGGVFYRYAGLRRPFIDMFVAQDWLVDSRYTDSSSRQAVDLLKRSQDAALTTTFARPRVRSFSSVSVGVGAERRSFATEPDGFLTRIDSSIARSYLFPRAFVSAGWSNTRRPVLSISPEDGVALAFTVRERLRTDAARRTASASAVASASGFKSLDLPGFAHHVLALRVAGGVADRNAASSLEVGGTSGTVFDVGGGLVLGEGRRTFGVRGFPGNSVRGTRALAGSLEYRAPLVLGGRGLGSLPVFFDRSSGALFVDAGTATCAARPLYRAICSRAPLLGRTIASAGAELGISAALFGVDGAIPIRFGVAVPIAGRTVTGVKAVSVYTAFGLSF